MRKPTLSSGKDNESVLQFVGSWRSGHALFEFVMWGGMLLVAGVLLWATLQPSEEAEATQEEIAESNRIVMSDVDITIHDQFMRPSAIIRGKEAHTFKNNQDFIVTPVRALLHRTDGQLLRVHAEKLWKRISRHDERMDFTGHVEVFGQDQRLLSDALSYHPNTHYLESESPIQMLTTGTVILGDKLRSNVDIQTGSLDGNVSIISMGQTTDEF